MTASMMCSTGTPVDAAISSNHRWAVLHGMAMSRAPACSRKRTPSTMWGSGFSPPAM